VTAGWAVIGLLVGHVAAYDLVFPDEHVHADALAGSGHTWLALVEPSLLVALAFVVIAGVTAARIGRPRVARFRRLVVIQASAFVALELGERLLAGHSPLDLAHELGEHGLWLILVVGVTVQVITAWLGSAASRGIAGLARTRAAVRPGRVRRTSCAPLPARHLPAARRIRDNASRAPPIPAT
jgi:hypothetical protein